MNSRPRGSPILKSAFWEEVEPAALFEEMGRPAIRKRVLDVMEILTVDPLWTVEIKELIRSKELESRCCLAWLAINLEPRNYLEVGVRRGFSMATVAACAPDISIYGFDLWVSEYGGVDNPGPAFVRSELLKVNYNRRPHLFSGNSHVLLPTFFRKPGASLWESLKMRLMVPTRPQEFDLIFVDGDHSLLGAYQDLLDLLPHCSVGGGVVFDDICPDLSRISPEELAESHGPDPHDWGDLLGVWRAVQPLFPGFRFFEYVDNPPGVGIAVRLSAEQASIPGIDPHERSA